LGQLLIHEAALMAEIVEQVPRLCVSCSFASNGEPDTNLPPITAHIDTYAPPVDRPYVPLWAGGWCPARRWMRRKN
jgi:hypothetical protein